MPAVTVGPVPVSVREALSLADAPGAVVWLGTVQNVSPTATVYRLRATSAPDPAAAAFRHPAGDRWAMTVYGDDEGATWLWTASGSAVVVLESGIPGV